MTQPNAGRAHVAAARRDAARPPTPDTVRDLTEHARRHAAHACQPVPVLDLAAHLTAAAGLALAALAHAALAVLDP